MSLTTEPSASAQPPHDPPQTTHSSWGAGNPRLIFTVGEYYDGSPAREFALVEPVTVIGSAEKAHLRLEGLDPTHARIVHEDDDEYVLYCVAPVSVGHVVETGDPVSERLVLRTGARVQVGSWSMFFTRDESADHGRPFGGRAGGELAHQKPQPDRPDYAHGDQPVQVEARAD